MNSKEKTFKVNPENLKRIEEIIEKLNNIEFHAYDFDAKLFLKAIGMWSENSAERGAMIEEFLYLLPSISCSDSEGVYFLEKLPKRILAYIAYFMLFEPSLDDEEIN